MRILMVVRPAVGGMKQCVLLLARGMAEDGHEVEIACPPGAEVGTEARALGVPVHDIDLVDPVRPVRDLRCTLALVSLVRRGRYDVVHMHGFKAALVGRLGAALGGCRTRVVTVHNHILYRDISSAKKLVHRVLERSLAPLATRIVAVSESIRDELVAEYAIDPARVIAIHNGIDLAPFLALPDRGAARESLGLSADALVIGTAGRFAEQKGLRYLMEAAPEVAEGRDVVFYVGGDGPLRDDLVARAAATGLGDRIRFPGFVRDVPALLAAIDVYVQPSLSEGLSIALIEAMAAAVPIVATTAGGSPEIVVDGVTGFLVPPAEPAPLATALVTLADDAALRRRFAEAARERALAEFDRGAMVERTLALYREVLGGTAVRG